MPPRRRGTPGKALSSCAKGLSEQRKSVLGDETAALKRAQSELEDLGDQLDREIAQATGTEPANRNPGEPRDGAVRARRANAQGKREGQDQGQRQPAIRKVSKTGNRVSRSLASSEVSSKTGNRVSRSLGSNKTGKTGNRVVEHGNASRGSRRRARGKDNKSNEGSRGSEEVKSSKGSKEVRGSRVADKLEVEASSRVGKGSKRKGRVVFGAATRRMASRRSKVTTGGIRRPAARAEATTVERGRPGQEDRSAAEASVNGPTGCAMWKSCWTTPRCVPRPLAFAIVCGENAKSTNATPRSPTGTS